MKELVRIEKGTLGEHLKQYCMTIYEGDIMYIQSFSERSLKVLQDILSGERQLESGRMYLNEKPVNGYNMNAAREYGIYTVTFGREFVDNMSIAENLKPIMPAYRLYSRRENDRRIEAYLKQEQIFHNEKMPVWSLSEGERKRLGVLRAKLFGAKLVILDMTRAQIEGKIADEICYLILKLREEGITFLILSSHYSEISRVATRTQYFSRGRDVKEWGLMTDAQREKLANGDLFFLHNGQKEKSNSRIFTGIYDYDWEMSEGIWKFLKYVKEKNPEIWDKYIGAEIPGDGKVYEKDTVIIPRDSADMLLENLSIGENLTILAGRRIATGKYGVIHKKYQQILEEDFYRRMHLKPSVKRVNELSLLQRKILFVSRFELLHPKIIILESPYGDMDWEEMADFEHYLQGLVEKGIRIIYVAQNLERMTQDCHHIINLKKGINAKIATI